MPKFIFFDIDEKIVSEYEKILSNAPNSSFFTIDFKSLLSKYKIDVIITASNSYMTMGGGIDRVYDQYFGDIKSKVQDIIKERKIAQTEKGHYYLPVGENLLVETHNNKCPYLLATPTMFVPEDITDTDNVKQAFLGALKVLKSAKMEDITVACSGLGTGVGGMNGRQSAKQILRAFNKFYDTDYTPYGVSDSDNESDSENGSDDESNDDSDCESSSDAESE
jgi:O-acetyl-ADP-ribose deacetylase (regulator of RNase III)